MDNSKIMTRKELTKYPSKLRKEWIVEKWREHKNEITMTDLADIFGIDLSYVFRILKEANETKTTKGK